MAKRHVLPPFLDGVLTTEAYRRWLKRKATAHVRRDRRRGRTCSVASYTDAIHSAVCASGGKDVYTGEPLIWSLISRYDNSASKEGRSAYKARFALLPTVDHMALGASCPIFGICSWRTNDAKNDLPLQEFIALCKRVLEHAGERTV